MEWLNVLRGSTSFDDFNLFSVRLLRGRRPSIQHKQCRFSPPDNETLVLLSYPFKGIDLVFCLLG